MVSWQKAALAPVEFTTEPRSAVSRVASLVVLIGLTIQLGLGIYVNLYVKVAAPGNPGSSGIFRGSPLLVTHVVLGVVLCVSAVVVLFRAVADGTAAAIACSAVGLMAILTAAAFGTTFILDVADGDSLGMGLATVVALVSYALGLFTSAAAPGRRS